MTVSCGIDEAGRGPVIGPLVLAACVLDDAGVEKLAGAGVRDSKKLSAARRVELEPLVKETALEWRTLLISAADIDRLRKRESLNAVEARKTVELLLALSAKPERIIVDAVDSVAGDYAKRISSIVHELNPDFVLPELVSEHKADDTYIEVAAASILAKVERDRRVDSLKGEHGDFGSGYPADPATAKFVKKLVREGNLPAFVRRSWNTVDKGKQTSLEDY